ncbi:ABC transporter ATP-binding protein [Candidatus Aerophobetes bacterium]|uniref:ABC transporter ATP-binding protein n=1 Tax=Aerophobetes bacterium TaxID=2030807 RepID=A0A2A4X6H5_UNCAE|nr:MAG: ABC transporter ATP-binding protein [Candidatus Aerophobetes bacterium]
MRLLVKAAIRQKKSLALMFITSLSLIGLTVASQLEIISFGVIANKGVDFFQLFSPAGAKDLGVDQSQIDVIFPEIGKNSQGEVTPETAEEYMHKNSRLNALQKAIYFIKKNYLFGKSFSFFILFLLCVALFKSIFLFISRYATQKMSIKISRDLRNEYFEHIQKLSLSFYHEYKIGSLSSRVAGDAHQIAKSLYTMMENYIHAPFTLISTFLVCIFMSWQLSLIVFVALPLIFVPITLINRKVKKITRQLQGKQESFSTVLIDFLSGIQTIKVFAMEAFAVKKYKEHNEAMAKLEMKTAKYDLLTRPLLHMVTTLCLSMVLIGGLYVFNMQLAELIIFVGLLYQFYEPVKKFAEKNVEIQKGVVAAERLYQVLDIMPKITDSKDAHVLKGSCNTIAFNNVSFRYKERWVLEGLSFSVSKGESIAVLGSTGVGKSTVASLLTRLYDTSSGSITIDKKDIRDIKQASLREHIAFVSQKPFLFLDTVAANIAFGRPFSRSEIIEAAKKAQAHDFIMNLPQGYDTPVDETGKNLSGGQQQRLSIARALVKKAPILILDEATSSLDSISEGKIKEALMNLGDHVIQFIIAHRLSTVEHASKILFLEDSKTYFIGTKDELMQKSPQFKKMWLAHFKDKDKDKDKEPEYTV